MDNHGKRILRLLDPGDLVLADRRFKIVIYGACTLHILDNHVTCSISQPRNSIDVLQELPREDRSPPSARHPWITSYSAQPLLHFI